MMNLIFLKKLFFWIFYLLVLTILFENVKLKYGDIQIYTLKLNVHILVSIFMGNVQIITQKLCIVRAPIPRPCLAVSKICSYLFTSLDFLCLLYTILFVYVLGIDFSSYLFKLFINFFKIKNFHESPD